MLTSFVVTSLLCPLHDETVTFYVQRVAGKGLKKADLCSGRRTGTTQLCNQLGFWGPLLKLLGTHPLVS